MIDALVRWQMERNQLFVMTEIGGKYKEMRASLSSGRKNANETYYSINVVGVCYCLLWNG